jgi:hypothetical protein
VRPSLILAAYGGGLAVVFAAALGAGAAVGDPLGDPAPGPRGAEHASDGTDADHAGAAGADGEHVGDESAAAGTGEAGDPAGGLETASRGLVLELVDPVADSGPRVPVSFRVLDTAGEAVTSYLVSHDERMHLVAVRRDLTGFQHVHPALADDGTWSVPLDLGPGSWRLFADFVPGAGGAAGEKVVLGTDLDVAGEFRPAPLPEPSTVATVDGYRVSLDGELVPGRESELTLTVTRAGRPVTDLQPYLGAYGHLVALRDGDLAYLHVHPAGEPGDGTTGPGPAIAFSATAPSAGDYRLFLDFRHGDEVRTAEFTVRADPNGRTPR